MARQANILLKLTPEEKAELAHAAAALALPLAVFIRTTSLQAARGIAATKR